METAAILEVKSFFLASDSPVNSSARRWVDAAKSQLMVNKRECREYPAIQGLLKEAAGYSTLV
jgi:hypothetical protein